MTDDNLTVARLCLAGFSRSEAVELAGRLDAAPTDAAPGSMTADDKAQMAAYTAEIAQHDAAVALQRANEQEAASGAGGYTEAQVRAMTAHDIASMDRTQFAAVQRVLATLRPAGGQR